MLYIYSLFHSPTRKNLTSTDNMAQNVKDGLNRMTSSEMCDFVRGWIHSLPDDRFSRVSSIIKLEGEYREKVGSKRKSNDGELDSNTASIPTKSPNKRSSDIIATSHQSPNSAIDLSDWICVFCKLTSHARGLGDLFGPYYVDGEQNGNPKPIVIPSKPRVPPKKMKYVEQSDAGSEIWFHDSCVSWASGVYLIGNHIKNVEEIISKSSQNVCLALITNELRL